MSDPINPNHYRQHPAGIECITITEHMNFCLGNAIKYIWRAGLKGDAIEDLRKAAFYIDREIKRLSKPEKPEAVKETKPDYGPVPANFKPHEVRRALAGERDGLGNAFMWSSAKQSYFFWEQQHYNGLTPEGRAILEHWLAESENRQPAKEGG